MTAIIEAPATLAQVDASTVVRYVVGLMFDLDMQTVALIRKNKPVWQAGLLNGIGGKIEPGESSLEAMVREFREETGKETFPQFWKAFLRMAGTNDDGSEFSIEFFTTVGNVWELETTEEEVVVLEPVKNIHPLRGDMIDNLMWIVPLAIDFVVDSRPSAVIATY